jgi:hypothetical protein
MSRTLALVQELVASEQIRISNHGYDELSEDGLLIGEVITGLSDAIVVEDYPNYAKGPCVLVLQKDSSGRPIHVLWGVPGAASTPAVLITAYRPDPLRWSDDFMRRRP